MVVLTGNNLGKRQQELNAKVADAAKNRVDFNHVAAETGKSDVDNLFKIGLASKYGNIDYILEVFKSGDSLSISRALKCVWLYDEEFANIIDPNFLHNNIFPFMSIKMKNKLLSTVSTHVRDQKRAEGYYTYCVDSKMISLALKFLIFTSESFKMSMITEESNTLLSEEKEYLRNFIGNSFLLAEAYLKKHQKYDSLYKLRYLYSVSDVKYIELIQKYGNIKSSPEWEIPRRLGLRISRDFMKKHKSRILEQPLLYLNIINKTILAKYTTIDDAKFYAIVFMPEENFWWMNYYETYKHILDVIPYGERLSYIKKIFSEKYPGEEFEMSLQFYTFHYYDLMTKEEKEAWALRHVASGEELLGSGKDYTWYKFVSFERAFIEIKKYIMVTQDGNERLELLKIMIESAKTQQELEKLLKYYYDRHINEERYVKECFVRSINDNHNVIDFNDDCWKALDKILYSLEVYSSTYGYFIDKFRAISLIYHIVNKKDVPNVLNKYIDTEAIKICYIKETCDNMSEERKEMVFRYLLQCYERKMKGFDDAPYDNDLKEKIKPVIYSVLDFLSNFEKTSDAIPDIFIKYMKLDSDSFKNHRLLHQVKEESTTQDDLLRYLKQDAKVVVNKLQLLKEGIENDVKFNRLLRKLKIYFSEDIAKKYLEFYNELLLAPELKYFVAKGAVYGILQIADEDSKIEFMKKYVPTEPKIDHTNINRNTLHIQEAICGYACKSRPPVPLENILMYIKGDYVHSCLPTFYSYMTNLPLPLCMKLVETIIDSPVSIQKHGIRLAFQCFSIENLKKLISDIWKKTKNVSLRSIMYKALVKKISEENEHEQKELFVTLKMCTLDINQTDDKELYTLIKRNNLPKRFVGEYLECIWEAVCKLPRNSVNIKRMCKVLNNMEEKINSVPKGILQSIVDDHMNNMFNKKEILNTKVNQNIEMLNNAMWQLTIANIVHVSNKEDLEKNLELVKFVVRNCFKMWQEVRNDTYIIRKFFSDFLQNLESKSYTNDIDSYADVNIIFKTILKDMEDTLTINEMYMSVWDLRLTILAREVMISAKHKLSEANTDDMEVKILTETSITFGQELRNLIKEFIEKQLLYPFSFSAIVEIITSKLQSFMRSFREFFKQEFLLDDVCVLISSILVEFEMPQMYMFALMILPSEQNRRFPETYFDVLKKINSFENGEVQCMLRHKFFNDFRFRRFVLF